MQNPVILVVLDGLNHDVGRHAMGHLSALVEAGRGTTTSLDCELPAMSRPLYECLLTGDRPVDSGVVHNAIVRRSHGVSLFDLARAQGRTTAAAAYHWVSELYVKAPFDQTRDRYLDDPNAAIQRGIFYWQDHYPDDHLFSDAEALRQRHAPDFLLVHSMNIDDSGHRHGGDSPQYRNAARHADIALADYLPRWLADGYQVMVTADHGMNADRSHSGLLAEERRVPLWLFGDAFADPAGLHIQQTHLCGTLASAMGLTHDKPFHPELLAMTAQATEPAPAPSRESLS
ncbi:alkaline phosphatase family protein [Halomonas sp. DP5Y7-2]|uniref:alkaline phosphatase family protein n=1 Tax=Halomonas sp. DP5Y7-2 TaxID=2859076 RepID=UPI001C99D050|nr:alkaline phosphatase family protein [Halomonas sp. DP5Y7-2]MBY5985886.1 alkaline phosphatase family protein [Halomonas sp. DP5Y7-2]